MTKKNLIAVGMVVLLLALILLSVKYTFAEPPLPTKPYSLVGVPADEVEKYVIEWAKAELRVTGEPTVALVRDVELDEVPELGLTRIGGDPERSYVLVVLKGDFDLYRTLPGTNGDPSKWHSRVSYVAYVFDRQTGTPALIETSLHSDKFRTFLNDPALPEVPPVQDEQTE